MTNDDDDDKPVFFFMHKYFYKIHTIQVVFLYFVITDLFLLIQSVRNTIFSSKPKTVYSSK